MRNATYLGLCLLATTFGPVAVALGQQPAAISGQPAAAQPAQPGQQPAAQQDASGLRSPSGTGPANSGASNGAGQDLNNQPRAGAEQRAMGAAGAPFERSMRPGTQQENGASPTMGAGQQRGELGVWLVETGGPGVEINRITDGSAAKQAGLRTGDIILQVNGRGATSPQAAARMIRQIPIGQAATLTIWRDGDQRQMQVSMQPAREIHEVGFRGESDLANGDLTSRTMRLEQQLGTMMQELQQMRQEMAQLRASGGPSAGLGTEQKQGTTAAEYAAVASRFTSTSTWVRATRAEVDRTE